MTALLEIDDLTVRYGRGGVAAVDAVSLAVERGASVGIVGESGCGKSTLAKALVGLVPVSSGTMTFDGAVLGSRRRRASRRRIQMVFQDPSSSLNPSRTVGQTLTELLRVHAMVPSARVDDRARELLQMVELPASLMNAYPRRLSGGQRQRVGIARALALEPDVLIADEAVAALDVSVQASVLNLLTQLRAELEITLLFISHDLAVVRHISERTVVMYLGRIVEDRPTEELFDDPRHPYTQALLAAAPRLGTRKLPGSSALPGEPPHLDAPVPGCAFHPRCSQVREPCREQEPALTGPDLSHRVACHFAGEPFGPADRVMVGRSVVHERRDSADISQEAG